MCDTPLAPKVQLEVHYESLSPESRSYVLNQLIPVYRSVEGIVGLEIVPFGLSVIMRNGQGDVIGVECTRGAQECTMNRVQVYMHLRKHTVKEINPLIGVYNRYVLA